MEYFYGVIALISGFLAGFSLIVAIGAQNAFVIKQGLQRNHVLLVVAFCSISDIALIILGIGGLGRLIQSHPQTLEFIRWFGVAYLIWFGIKSLKSVFQNQTIHLNGREANSTGKILLTLLTFTFLNPHVYLDTVILLGSIANQFTNLRWYFALGASLASITWFSLIGFGARLASKYMTYPILWKILDSLIAFIMFTIAISLALFKFN